MGPGPDIPEDDRRRSSDEPDDMLVGPLGCGSRTPLKEYPFSAK